MGPELNFGVIDQRFLARSLGLLDPKSPIVVYEESSVKQTVDLLKQHKVGGVVVTNTKNMVTGMFTERDVVMKVALSTMDLEKTSIAEVMTPNPQTAEMTTTVAYALSMMSHGGYRHIPIVDDHKMPVGIISVKDIVDYIAGALTKDLFKIAT